MGNKNWALTCLNVRRGKILFEGEFLILPKVYSAFISNYELGSETDLFNSLRVQTDSKPEPVTIRWENSRENNPWKIEGDRLLGMTTTEDLRYEIKEYHQKIEVWHQSGMIKIGWTHGDLILLGLESDKLDKIFIYGESSDNGEFYEIAENVFSMFAKIELVPDEQLLDFYKVDLNGLSKDWGSNYWKKTTYLE